MGPSFVAVGFTVASNLVQNRFLAIDEFHWAICSLEKKRENDRIRCAVRTRFRSFPNSSPGELVSAGLALVVAKVLLWSNSRGRGWTKSMLEVGR